ncbi:GPI-anchored protein [Colletotrichum sojae]|uniref:GPI-anchored protein n=1 Tax=Colletotrichum sojae TaxID=2175907 RepID=A0A8H6ILL8_9PEZI|nr:GPI-anchored protein [Colletotrichum sojae]
MFETILTPDDLGVLAVGYTCVNAPKFREGTAPGTKATFRLRYISNFAQDESKSENLYACADVTFVESLGSPVPCFNSSLSKPIVDVTPLGVNPHGTNGISKPTGKKGLSGGAIAGAVVGSVAGAAVLGLAAFFLWRRNRSLEAAAAERKQQGSDFQKVMSERPPSHGV